MLDQWAKGTAPARQQVQSLRDELSITAAIGRALPDSALTSAATPPHPLQALLCGTPPGTLNSRADPLAALCRTVEAHIAALKNKDANAMPLLNLARSAAARVGGSPNSK
jgi:hypothetical protein